ncbi:AraC family transcriptional regulator [Stutzerimonas chloritidismutans]|uniref:AraC family transcriptional regulator n=1 Tax=Stutzerimonas chloritidismutans TaxID=203192 RepID=A0ABU9M362_STUCH
MRFRLPGDERWISAKSILIPAGTRVSLENQGGVMSACYLDATKPDFQVLKRRMVSMAEGVYYNLADESRLTSGLTQLRDEAPGFAEAQLRIEALIHDCTHTSTVSTDPRIIYVIDRLRDTASMNISVSSLASEVGLSESSLIRLFSLHVGTPLRRHRLWFRLIEFVTLMLSGVPVASAIKRAGFTDASHLSRCYSRFFGVNLSYAFSKSVNARYIIDSRRAAQKKPPCQVS